MRLSPDIMIFPFAGAPEYFLMYSDQKGIVMLLRDSFYHSMKDGNVSAYDEYFLLMNDLISAERDMPFHEVLADEPFEISIEWELERTRKRREQFFLEEFRTPDISRLTDRINMVIREHFHDRFIPIVSPSEQKLITSYRNMDRIVNAYVYGKGPDSKSAFVKEAYHAVAAIRLADDFIDKDLWPERSSFHPEELRELFCQFLKVWLSVVREFDPDMPDNILDLVFTEMDLILNSSQENFDRNIGRLIESKSLDVFHIYRKIHNIASGPIPAEVLSRLGLIDYIRDFNDEAIAGDTDLNLYTYIRDNNLDPGKLVDYLMRLLEREDPVGCRIAKARMACHENPVAIERQRTGIPVFTPFPDIFARAINMLRVLERK